jgi:hypothetical protein
MFCPNSLLLRSRDEIPCFLNKNTLFRTKLSLLACSGNYASHRCGTAVSDPGINSGSLEIMDFPAKFPVSREIPWRPVRSALRRQPTTRSTEDSERLVGENQRIEFEMRSIQSRSRCGGSGFAAYNEWACKVGWKSVACPPAAPANLPSVDQLFPLRGTRAYDQCLVEQRGRTDACDAIMRMRDADERLKKQ